MFAVLHCTDGPKKLKLYDQFRLWTGGDMGTVLKLTAAWVAILATNCCGGISHEVFVKSRTGMGAKVVMFLGTTESVAGGATPANPKHLDVDLAVYNVPE